ncbi:hypothetical protein L1987_08804 [Smallanthus sonchifolius]|uniref:Uncharacterized protein n=1 Tax=Smallanthus sonchifolius TaxID=185202 RepID=A0ACB9JLM0_9ASTR|nr:hypothetical protein L1987_08804 [Smallanthus sonchifolius]
MTGPESIRTFDLTLPDPHHSHCHTRGKCPMWLPAESLSTKLNARTTSTNKKYHRSDATSQFRKNTVSAPERLQQPKPRIRDNARKKTHLLKKVTFGTMEKGKPSTQAPPAPSPQDPSRYYIQLYRYFDRKSEANENLGWLTARGKDMKARLDYHTELTTNMSRQMHEMEQDILLNNDKTIAAMKEALAAKIQSRVAIAVVVMVSIVSLLFQMYL